MVLVVATGGEWGETPEDLAAGETLAERRAAEVAASAAALGIARVAFLGYQDSGMTGWEQNAHPESFINAPLDEAAARLAAILKEEQAATLTTYDWHGGYGHPDHVAVHRVGARAAQLAATKFVYEATMNRDAMLQFFKELQKAGVDPGWDPESGTDDGNPVGTPAADLTTAIDVSAFIASKKASMAAHRSQISDTSIFQKLPDDVFATAFGTEWFRQVTPAPDTVAGTVGSAGPSQHWLEGLG